MSARVLEYLSNLVVKYLVKIEWNGMVRKKPEETIQTLRHLMENLMIVCLTSYQVCPLLYLILKYLRQFCYSYWWRARHMDVYKPLVMTSKMCWNMGVTRELAPVLRGQFLHSYWSRATAGTAVPHDTIRATQTAFPYKELFTRGTYHFQAEGVLCWKKSLNNYNFAFILFFYQKVLMLFDRKCIYEWESKCVESNVRRCIIILKNSIFFWHRNRRCHFFNHIEILKIVMFSIYRKFLMFWKFQCS